MSNVLTYVLTCVQYSHSAWFLDSRASIFVSDAVKPRGCISRPLWLPRDINKAAWDTKLILTADLAFPASCASLNHLLMAQHCHLCLRVCFSPPTAPHLPPPTTQPALINYPTRPHYPFHPLPPPHPLQPPHTTPPPKDSISDITAIEKTTSKTRGIQIHSLYVRSITYEIRISYVHT